MLPTVYFIQSAKCKFSITAIPNRCKRVQDETTKYCVVNICPMTHCLTLLLQLLHLLTVLQLQGLTVQFDSLRCPFSSFIFYFLFSKAVAYSRYAAMSLLSSASWEHWEVRSLFSFFSVSHLSWRLQDEEGHTVLRVIHKNLVWF